MHIIVCIKAVPTTGRQPAAKSDGTGIETEGDCFINGSDEYALEQALLFKRALSAKVTVITVGSMKSQEVLQLGIAKGADEAIRVDADEFDPNVTSFLLARAIANLDYDLILTGVESSDGMASQVPVALASQLGVPYVYAVTKIELEQDKPLLATRELGGGRYQTLEVQMPAVLCTQSGIAPLTYAPTVKLIHARRRGVPAQSPSALGIGDDELAQRRSAKIVDIKPVEKNNTTQWLKGSPAELARDILAKIKEAR
jgi:electron transfer flavoprotein beta subunit